MSDLRFPVRHYVRQSDDFNAEHIDAATDFLLTHIRSLSLHPYKLSAVLFSDAKTKMLEEHPEYFNDHQARRPSLCDGQPDTA